MRVDMNHVAESRAAGTEAHSESDIFERLGWYRRCGCGSGSRPSAACVEERRAADMKYSKQIVVCIKAVLQSQASAAAVPFGNAAASRAAGIAAEGQLLIGVERLRD